MTLEELAAAVAAAGGVLIGPTSTVPGGQWWKVAHRTSTAEYVVAEVGLEDGHVARWEPLSGAPVVIVGLVRALGDPDQEGGQS